MKVPAYKVAAYLARPLDKKIRAVLLYGRNAGALSTYRRQLVREALSEASGADPDPMALAELDDAHLQANPAALAEEAATRPMFGGRKIITVRAAKDKSALSVADYLAAPGEDALVIVEAGNLTPANKMRRAFEASEHAIALPAYEDDARQVRALVLRELKERACGITPEALSFMLERLGDDRGVILQELERILLYKGEPAQGERHEIDLQDLQDAGTDNDVFSQQKLVDALLAGEMARADRMLRRLEQFGVAPMALLANARRHLFLLQRARARWEQSQNLQEALAAFQPPVHFTRRGAVEQQCRRWSQDLLARALKNLFASEARARQSGVPASLQAALARQSLLRLGRMV